MKLVALFAILAVASALTYEPALESFEVWQAMHGKSYPRSARRSVSKFMLCYSLSEVDRRFAIWANNVNRVREMNAKAQIPNSGLEGEFEGSCVVCVHVFV